LSTDDLPAKLSPKAHMFTVVLLFVRSTWLKRTPAEETQTASSSGHDQSGTRFYRVMRKSGADSYAPEQLD